MTDEGSRRGSGLELALDQLAGAGGGTVTKRTGVASSAGSSRALVAAQYFGGELHVTVAQPQGQDA